MRDSEYIGMVFLERHRVFERFDKVVTARFRGNKFSRWLQSKMWSYLVKHSLEVETDKYRKVSFKRDDICRYLDENFQMIKYINEKRITQVLMGGEDFEEFLYSIKQGGPEGFVREGVDFSVKVAEGYSDRYGTHVHYRDIPVRVVPHMKGVLFL